MKETAQDQRGRRTTAHAERRPAGGGNDIDTE